MDNKDSRLNHLTNDHFDGRVEVQLESKPNQLALEISPVKHCYSFFIFYFFYFESWYHLWISKSFLQNSNIVVVITQLD